MHDRNKNRPGYKETKVGWIPDEWATARLNEASLIKGQYGACASAVPFDQKKPRYIRITDIADNGRIYSDNQASVDLSEANNYLLNDGDFLFARTGATVGKSYLHRDNGIPYAYAGYLIRFTLDQAKLNVDFLSAYTRTHRYWYWIGSTLHAGAQPNINAEEYGSLLLPLPPLPEQEKIAEVLGCWDEGLECLEKLIDAKKLRKKGLMQQLLTGTRRLPEFQRSEWKEVRLGDVFTNRSVKNHGQKPVLSVTQDQGVVLRDSLDRKINMTDTNTHTYKLVRKGDFIISLRSFQGGLEYSYLEGLVSPAYHVIYPKIQIDELFFKHFFKSYWFIAHLAVAIIGIRDGKQVSFSDFTFLKMSFPSLAEQRAIAEVLETADEEIRLLEAERDALSEQKKGLMQKLLTGEVRCLEYRAGR